MLEAGPELDRMIGEAIGYTPTEYLDRKYGPASQSDCGNIDCKRNVFSPSTDLNDAFWAAEKAGLFTDHVASLFRLDEAGEPIWGVSVSKDDAFRGDTPALAICAAILKLKEASDV